METAASVVHVGKVEDITSRDQISAALDTQLEKLLPGTGLSPGSEVMIKLNLCLLKGFETGATVDPVLARVLVDLLLEKYGASRVYLAESDATHLSAWMAFKVLGWEDVFRGMDKVTFFNLTEDEPVEVPARFMEDLKMSKKMMEVDYLISLAKLKTHTQQKTTCILKNQFGAIPYKYKVVYHTMLDRAIYDSTAARPPDLSVIDGLISMEGNGPTNGVPRRTKMILTSNDAVSMDHFCARLMGFRPGSIPNLKLAKKYNLGSFKYDVVGDVPQPLNLKFMFLPKWKELIKKAIGLMGARTINEEA